MTEYLNELTDQEKRSTFYQAIIGAISGIRREDLNMEVLRKTMYRIQEDNDASKRRGVDKNVLASRVRVQKSKNNDDKCLRCN